MNLKCTMLSERKLESHIGWLSGGDILMKENHETENRSAVAKGREDGDGRDLT